MSFRFAEDLFPARFPLVIPAFCVALIAVFWIGSAPGAAQAKSGKRVVLGKSSHKPIPDCGLASSDRDCKIEGKVTLFQSIQRGTRGRTFVVPVKKGKIVSWSISLSRPTARKTQQTGDPQIPFFNHLFGSPASARIAVLKQVDKKRKGPPRFKMVRQSPTQILNPYFGKTVHFALTRPLNVIKNQIVALTIPTWAPAFWTPKGCSASQFGGLVDPVSCAASKRDNAYRASRGTKRCLLGFERGSDTPNEALKKTRPQQKVNSVKPYGCYYRGSRMLYTATVVAK